MFISMQNEIQNTIFTSQKQHQRIYQTKITVLVSIGLWMVIMTLILAVWQARFYLVIKLSSRKSRDGDVFRYMMYEYTNVAKVPMEINVNLSAGTV